MIKKEAMKILSSKQIALETFELVLENAHISQHALPGQFVHLAVPGHTLRRPISIAATDRNKETVTILFKQIGKGTKALADLPEGTFIDALGPNGNGFPLAELEGLKEVLLIGGGIGVPPLYFLASALKERGITVKAILGYQHAEYVFYEEKFRALGETYIVTNDGSYGHKGFVTDVVGEVGHYDRYYSCGPMPMLRAVQHTCAGKEGYLSFEERMGCGVGACYACVIPTNDEAGFKKICQQGPVFSAEEVSL